MMTPSRPDHSLIWRRTFVFVGTLALLALACSQLLPSPTPTATTLPPEPSVAAPATAGPTATQAAQPTSAPQTNQQPLLPEGPWLVFSTQHGLHAVNPDGSGLTVLRQTPGDELPDGEVAIAPSGGHVAYEVESEGFQVSLVILRLPSLQQVANFDLLPAQSEGEPPPSPGSLELEPYIALAEQDSLAFAPDGSGLALMAAIEGPTSDLYHYSLESQQLTQLTDGPSQAYQPSWSPDSQHILHSGVNSFGTGAGFNMAGIWTARADDSEVQSLYSVTESSAEQFHGWLDAETFLVSSWDPICGYKNFRSFNLGSLQPNELWPGYFQAVAVSEQDQVALIATAGENCAEQPIGLYFIDLASGDSYRILEEQALRLRWSDPGQLFLAHTEFGLISVDTRGQYVDLQQPEGADPWPSLSPGDKSVAWPGQALWYGPLLTSIENPLQMIFPSAVSWAKWDPTGRYLLFQTEQDLYVMEPPNLEPRLMAQDIGLAYEVVGWLED